MIDATILQVVAFHACILDISQGFSCAHLLQRCILYKSEYFAFPQILAVILNCQANFQVEEGRIARERPGFGGPIQQTENIEGNQAGLLTPADAEKVIREAWARIGAASRMEMLQEQSEMATELATKILQRSQGMVQNQHFSGRAALYQVCILPATLHYSAAEDIAIEC